MEPSDRNFDDLVGHFKKNIYETPKGRIRLHILQDDLKQSIPGIEGTKHLHILDAGAGLGYMSSFLASYGHQLVLCDVSKDSLEQAEQHLCRQHPQATFHFINAAVQELHSHVTEQFDLVLFHAVLEWMREPRHALQQIVKHVKPGGYLSLMYYNRHSLIYRHLLNANFKVLEDNQPRLGDRLVPVSPLDPEVVTCWYKEEGLQLIQQSGVRVIFDYLGHQQKKQLDMDTLLKMERRYSRIRPYADLARYQHLILKKSD